MNPPPRVEATASRCRCGHDRDAHEHFRPGTDCGVCGADRCAAFRDATPTLTRVLRRLRPGRSTPGGPTSRR